MINRRTFIKTGTVAGLRLLLPEQRPPLWKPPMKANAATPPRFSCKEYINKRFNTVGDEIKIKPLSPAVIG